jgi:nitrate reductase gamma subunit
MENPALHYNAEFQLTWESCGFATPPSISPAPTPTSDSYTIPAVTVSIVGALAGLGGWLWKRNSRKRMQPSSVLQDDLLVGE